MDRQRTHNLAARSSRQLAERTDRRNRRSHGDRGRETKACHTSDRGLILAMRVGESWAWSEFLLRFGTRLERYARRIEIPSADWPECVADLVEDEAIRLATPSAAIPDHLTAYLHAALRHRWNRARSANELRTRAFSEIGGDRLDRSRDGGDPPVESAMEEGRDMSRREALLVRFVSALLVHTSEPDRVMLTWRANRVSRSEIAAWLGCTASAATKRSWRLTNRLRRDAHDLLRAWPDEEERTELSRILASRGPSARSRAASKAAAGLAPLRGLAKLLA